MSLGPARAEIRALVEQLDPARMPPAESERILEEVRRERPELAAAAEAWLVRIGQLYDNLADLPANEQERRLGDEQKSNPDVASLVARLLQVTEFQVPIWLGSLPAEALAPRIPHYEVLEELGRGGMGVVYTARHRALGRIDALKVLLPEQLDDPDRRDRFNKEAKALALLKHPNVVQIYNYDAGEQADCPYLLMEFVDGGNLSKQLGGNPLQVRRAVQLVETLARAMHVVHECGVIHRDLKPVNVLLAADGTPKIADFGLARQVGGPGNETPSCYIMGTPSYVAPEQAQGKNDLIGERTDVYALGAILYECLTGQPPFHGETTQDTLRQVCEEVPKAPSQWNPSVPRPLEAICLRCLEKEPDKRYKTANELADALDGFRQEAERSRQVVSSRFLRIVGAVVLGISALLSLLLITLAPGRLLWVGFVATGSSVGVWLSLCTFHEAFRCTFLNGSPFFRPRGKESETTWVAPRSDGTSLHGWGAVHWALTFMILPIAL